LDSAEATIIDGSKIQQPKLGSLEKARAITIAVNTATTNKIYIASDAQSKKITSNGIIRPKDGKGCYGFGGSAPWVRFGLGCSHGGVCRPACRVEETISYHAKAQQGRIYFGAES
jgi:hypothetical protein